MADLKSLATPFLGAKTKLCSITFTEFGAMIHPRDQEYLGVHRLWLSSEFYSHNQFHATYYFCTKNLKENQSLINSNVLIYPKSITFTKKIINSNKKHYKL